MAYARAGREVMVTSASYDGTPSREQRDGMDIVRVPSVKLPKTGLSLNFDMAFALRPGLLRNLTRRLDAFAPEIIHQHGQFFNLTWASGEYARRRRAPTLLTVHTPLENANRINAAVLKTLDRVLVRTALRRYRPPLVVIDQLMEQYITDRYRGLYPALYPITIGLDLAEFHRGDAARALDQLRLPASTPIIASVGHVIPLRSRIPLIEALPAVAAAVPDVKVAVGGGLYHSEFLARAEQLGVADRVVAIGSVRKEEVADYLAATTVECHEQGIGIAMLAAIAAGVPVVVIAQADNFPGLPLTDRGEMYLCKPGDQASLTSIFHGLGSFGFAVSVRLVGA
jgi:glycosyltransferase involved in cell wall biosynthesis